MIDCYVPEWGWWSATHQCYFKLADPQPSLSDPNYPGGRIGQKLYRGVCYWPSPSPGNGWRLIWAWFADPPPGTPVTPEELAERAVDSMTLLGPDIHTSIRPGGMALVGVPVWLWTSTGPSRWGPTSATASVTGLSVTAVARAVAVHWQLGDGTSLTCTGPGTPYQRHAGRLSSPTCGHVYLRSSARQPNERYPLTATTTWHITWSGGGDSGAMTRTRTSTASLTVGELQVLIGS